MAAGRWSRFSAFLRSFLIQGSWNHRTMIGGGIAYSLLPVIRRLYWGDQEAFQAALNRHSEHFNSHPYLANLALGAVIRMEEDGRSPDEIRRFKHAIRGPLGSLGDSLVWVGWRPATVLAALLLAFFGVPPIWVVIFFLVIYNLGHLAVRVIGFELGLRNGNRVGQSLKGLSLSLYADRLRGLGVFLLGGVLGSVMAHGWSMGPRALLWYLVAALGLFAGSKMGQNCWRWTLWMMSGIIALGFLMGRIG